MEYARRQQVLVPIGLDARASVSNVACLCVVLPHLASRGAKTTANKAEIFCRGMVNDFSKSADRRSEVVECLRCYPNECFIRLKDDARLVNPAEIVIAA